MVKELGCAVIDQAVRDYRGKLCDTLMAPEKRDAEDFLFSKRLDEWIDMFGLDLDAEYIRNKLGVENK